MVLARRHWYKSLLAERPFHDLRRSAVRNRVKQIGLCEKRAMVIPAPEPCQEFR
jgi:hypothetical protein